MLYNVSITCVIEKTFAGILAENPNDALRKALSGAVECGQSDDEPDPVGASVYSDDSDDEVCYTIDGNENFARLEEEEPDV